MNLRLRERSVINQPAEVVWQHVADPGQFVKWNKKLLPTGLPEVFRQGHSFQSQYQWRGKCIASKTCVDQLIPVQVLRLHHSGFIGNGIRPDMEVIEAIQLTAKGTKTVVIKIVTMKNHGIPFVFVMIGWLISHLGKRVEPDYLKELCEQPKARSLQND